jgi:HAD superfamily hydrolase (TIGR01490 family)
MNLVLFDLDNTLLAGDSDYEWAQFLIDRGLLEREIYETANDRFYEQYRDGTLDIHEFLDFQLAPLARYPRAQLEAWHAEFMAAKVRPMIAPGTAALIDRHRDAGSLMAIITATNAFVTRPIARELGVPHLIATEPEMRDGEYTGRPTGVPCFQAGKITRLEQWLGEDGRTLESFADTWFYSDSHNDLPLLRKVAHPVAVDPDDRLRAEAEAQGWPIVSLR